MFLSQSYVNSAMDFRNTLVKETQSNMGSSSFSPSLTKMFSNSMPCFSETSADSFGKSMENSLCHQYPAHAGFSIASSAKSQLNLNQELPSIGTVLAKFVNTFKQGMPSQEAHSIQFLECLGFVELQMTETLKNVFQQETVIPPKKEKVEVPSSVVSARMTYAQVTKLPPGPHKVLAKLPFTFPIHPSCTVAKNFTDTPQNNKPALQKCDTRGIKKCGASKNALYNKKPFTPKSKQAVADSPVLNEVGTHRISEGSQKMIHKNRSRRRRGRKGKRELGGKGMYLSSDPDGTIWASQHEEPSTPIPPSVPSANPCLFDCVSIALNRQCPLKPVIKGSSPARHDSESSDEPPVPKPISRLRSLSDCSVGSVDSEDSFIVFAVDNGTQSDLDDNSECSESDNDEDEVDFVCPDWKNDCFSPDNSDLLSPNTYPPKKRVQFSDNVVIHPLVVWSCAQRLARVGPWEQIARDRVRFASRIADASKILTPVLDPEHRASIYNQHFATS